MTIADGGDGPRYRLGLALARLGDKAIGQTGLLDYCDAWDSAVSPQATGRTARLGRAR